MPTDNDHTGCRALRAEDRGRGSPVGEEMAPFKEVREGFFALHLSRKQPEKVKAFQEGGRAQARAGKCGEAACVRELGWPSGAGLERSAGAEAELGPGWGPLAAGDGAGPASSSWWPTQLCTQLLP